MGWIEMLVEWCIVWLGYEGCKLIDAMMEIFNVIVGVEDMGDGTNLVDEVLTNSTIMNVFWMIFVIGVALACIFAVIAIIQNMVTGKKTLSGIIGKLCMALLGTLVAYCCVLLGILVFNQLLSIINNMFLNGRSSMSLMIVNACIGGEGETVGSLFDSNGEYVKVSGAQGTLLGTWTTQWWIFPKSWDGNGLIKDPENFYYLEFCICAVAVIICIGIAIVNMTKRLFELVFVYLMMPAAMSVIPFDDGARMKNWTECMVSKFLTAYGTVIAINVYVIIVGIITPLEFSPGHNFWNCVFTCLILIGGAMVIPKAQNLFIRIFGSREDMSASFAPLMAAMHAATRVVRVAGSAGKAVSRSVEKHQENKEKAKAADDESKRWKKLLGEDPARPDKKNKSSDASNGGGAYKDALPISSNSSSSSSSNKGSSGGAYSDKGKGSSSPTDTNLPTNE